MSTKIEKTVEFTIHRFDPQNKRNYVSTYKVPIRKGTTILEALQYIKDNIDETLTFRHSCRMGICGSCGINVDGKPMLACYTQVLDLGLDSLVLEPLANMPVIKDLVVDIQPFFDTYKRIKTVLMKPEEELKQPNVFVQMPSDLKKYWDLSLCTKCSICYSACPAAIDSKFLGPSTLSTNYRFILDSRDAGSEERLKPMSDNVWLCTSCNSCTMFCPKLVDSSNAVVDNRSLIVETGAIPRTVKDVLESTYKYHNPMGMHPSKRMEWIGDLKVKTFPTTTNADVLYFVCCLTAYDARNQNIARSMASLFDALCVDYVTLGTKEWCCGDHMLRMGEKGLFESLAEHNLAMFEKLDFDRIVTLSPHCYNTFKNDKPYSDAKLNVQHYTQFVAEKLEKGELKLSKTGMGKIAYHDPCFLGKRNQIFDVPRHVLQSLSGTKLIEMKRTRESSFCCGGGAGRTWTEEATPEKRPSVNRIREALELGVEALATSCPFCVTTLEDAIKVLDVEGKTTVKDISELVKEAM